MYKIFIVEDDASIFSSIKTYLEGFAMEVEGVRDFNQVLEDFKAFDPHLVVMDIGLPYKNGLYWTEKIRKISQVPLVFLSSMGEETDQVLAMNLGADDYMVKPISLALLLAKIKAQIRRTYEVQAKDSEVQDGDLSLNLDTMDLTYQGRKKKLTKNEFLILKACIQGRGKVISREDLMNDLWQSDIYIDDNTLTVNVGRLRKTLKDLGVKNYIQTKKGVGYYGHFEK